MKLYMHAVQLSMAWNWQAVACQGDLGQRVVVLARLIDRQRSSLQMIVHDSDGTA